MSRGEMLQVGHQDHCHNCDQGDRGDMMLRN